MGKSIENHLRHSRWGQRRADHAGLVRASGRQSGRRGDALAIAAGTNRPANALHALIFAAGLAVGLAGAAHAQCANPMVGLQVPPINAFTQARNFKGVAKPLLAQGEVEISANQVRWHVKKPADIVTLITPTGVTQSVEGGPAQALGPSGADSFFASNGLRDLLSGNFAAIRSLYEISALPAGKAGEWHLRLAPKGAALARFLRFLDVRGCTNLTALRVQQANGDWMDIQFSRPASAN